MPTLEQPGYKDVLHSFNFNLRLCHLKTVIYLNSRKLTHAWSYRCKHQTIIKKIVCRSSYCRITYTKKTNLKSKFVLRTLRFVIISECYFPVPPEVAPFSFRSTCSWKKSVLARVILPWQYNGSRMDEIQHSLRRTMHQDYFK